MHVRKKTAARIIKIQIIPLFDSLPLPRFISGGFYSRFKFANGNELSVRDEQRPNAETTEERKRKARELCALSSMERNKGQERKNGNKRGEGKKEKTPHTAMRDKM